MDPKQKDEQFAEEFNAAPTDAPAGTGADSDDVAFGLVEEASAPAGGADATADPDAAAAPAQAAAEPSAADEEHARLKEWEASLAERESKVAAQEAAAANPTNTAASSTEQEAAPGGQDEPKGDTEGEDAEAAIAEDFGPEFVTNLKALIKSQVVLVMGGADIPGMGATLGTLANTVNDVIEALKDERQASHFAAIKAAHEDFHEIIASPEFEAWKAALAPEKKADVERIEASGTKEEVIGVLTEFKASKQVQGDADNDAIDNAAGVRSGGGLKLPADPAAGKDSYADAWNNF